MDDVHHNILTIVTKQLGYTFCEALNWTSNYHNELKARFLKGKLQLPSFGPGVDPQLERFIEAIAMWPRANDSWTFESGRYFGSKGLEIQQTRVVPFMPKVVDVHDALRRENVVIPLIEL